MSDLEEKILFVSELSVVITKFQKNVINIEYEVYEHNVYNTAMEFLVITYKGGAMSVRICNGNSISAIYEEIADKLEHCYYTEIPEYESIKNSDKYTRIYK